MIGLICGKSIEESGKPREHFNPPGTDTSTKLVGELYDWFSQEFGSVKCENIRSRHEQEVDASSDTKKLTAEEKMQRVHAKCDELCGKTAARTVAILWAITK